MNTYNSFYKTVGGGEGNKCYYPTRLDPYGKGCYYNCKYCYAKQLLDFRKLWNVKDIGVAPIEAIFKKIKKIPKGSVVRLGGMTDCFQPIEKKISNTYKTIKMLNYYGIHYLIVTKSSLISTENYLNILDKDLAHIQVSIATNDNNVLRLTDNAENFEKRKETIEILFNKGYDISLRLAPILYETIDYDIINNINVDKCLIEFLRVKPSMEKELGNIVDFSKYTIKEGGYRHLPLENKLNIIEQINYPQITICDDVQEHYDYFKENINFNENDCCNLNI